MDKSTKYCDLAITLTTGLRMTGRFHVDARTGSTIRPSDALRVNKEGFLLLSDVTIHDTSGARSHPAVLLPCAAIAYIELPPTRWQTPSPFATERPGDLRVVLPT